MILKMFSVYDTKAAVFHAPFFTPSKVECDRFLSRAVQDLASDYKEFTSDYVLFELGEFDNLMGVIAVYDNRHNCGPLTQYKKDCS